MSHKALYNFGPNNLRDHFSETTWSWLGFKIFSHLLVTWEKTFSVIAIRLSGYPWELGKLPPSCSSSRRQRPLHSHKPLAISQGAVGVSGAALSFTGIAQGSSVRHNANRSFFGSSDVPFHCFVRPYTPITTNIMKKSKLSSKTHYVKN